MANIGTLGVWVQVSRVLDWCSLVTMYNLTSLLVSRQLNRMELPLLEPAKWRTDGSMPLLLHNCLFFPDYKSSAHSLCFMQQKHVKKKVKITDNPYILRKLLFNTFLYILPVFFSKLYVCVCALFKTKTGSYYSNSLAVSILANEKTYTIFFFRYH